MRMRSTGPRSAALILNVSLPPRSKLDFPPSKAKLLLFLEAPKSTTETRASVPAPFTSEVQVVTMYSHAPS